MALSVNSKAPDFSLESTSGTTFNLSKDMAGKACVIYFYPKDFTPGCTQEACSFRDSHHVLADLNIPVFGISKDSIETHLKFKEAHNLPFELLSDPTGKVCKAYKALIPILKVPKRITYLLNNEHQIEAVFDSMFDAAGHIKAMMKAVEKN